jgi:hypothetical protein
MQLNQSLPDLKVPRPKTVKPSTQVIRRIDSLDRLAQSWNSRSAEFNSPIQDFSWLQVCAKSICADDKLRSVVSSLGEKIAAIDQFSLQGATSTIGYYSDYPNVNLRAGYLAIIDKLAGRATHVAVATHHPLLAAEALLRLQVAGTSCELELLFGLPMNAVRKVAAKAGVEVRVYIPYGESYLPYALSQVRKKPEILLWVVRDALLAK